jgi:hypothetical protein
MNLDGILETLQSTQTIALTITGIASALGMKWVTKYFSSDARLRKILDYDRTLESAQVRANEIGDEDLEKTLRTSRIDQFNSFVETDLKRDRSVRLWIFGIIALLVFGVFVSVTFGTKGDSSFNTGHTDWGYQISQYWPVLLIVWIGGGLIHITRCVTHISDALLIVFARIFDRQKWFKFAPENSKDPDANNE